MPMVRSTLDSIRREATAATTPNVVMKNSKMESSQIVKEFAAKPADWLTVKTTDIHPQMELGRRFQTVLPASCRDPATVVMISVKTRVTKASIGCCLYRPTAI